MPGEEHHRPDPLVEHGGQNPATDVPFYSQTFTAAGSATTAVGTAGTWTIDLDFTGASLAGALSVTSN